MRDDAGALVAMAGERLRAPGFTEICAVCTLPAARGRGLAAMHTGHVAAGIRARGDVPLLHVARTNTTARRVYERLGFAVRRPVVPPLSFALSSPIRVARTARALLLALLPLAGCDRGAVPGADGASAPGGTVVFFSMATSFSAAALGAEGLAADVTMLVGNGYVPGHAELALALLRGHPGVRSLFERRLGSGRPGAGTMGP